MTIWKYKAHETVDMPKGARVVHVGAQGKGIYLWAIVDPDAEREERAFTFVGTGGGLPDGEYIGTCQDDAGFVWHVYEVLP